MSSCAYVCVYYDVACRIVSRFLKHRASSAAHCHTQTTKYINGLTKASKRPKGICNNGTSRIYRVREIQPTIVIVLRCFWFCSWCCRCTNYHLRAPIQLPLSIGLTEHARTIGSSIDGLFFFSFFLLFPWFRPTEWHIWLILSLEDRQREYGTNWSNKKNPINMLSVLCPAAVKIHW